MMRHIHSLSVILEEVNKAIHYPVYVRCTIESWPKEIQIAFNTMMESNN